MKKLQLILHTVGHVGRWNIFLIIVINLLQGLVVSLEVVVWQKLVDGIVSCLSAFVISKITMPICGYMILACISLLMGRLSAYVNWDFAVKLSNDVNNELLSKCARVRCSVYHDSDFYDELTRINSESAGSIAQMVSGTAALVQYAMAYAHEKIPRLGDVKRVLYGHSTRWLYDKYLEYCNGRVIVLTR